VADFDALYGRDGWGPECGYRELLALIGEPVVVTQVGSYQGDYLVLFKGDDDLDDDLWGFLTFGYGSCSGCDALQSCGSAQDLQELYERLRDSTKWESKAVMEDYVTGKDYEGEFYGSYKEDWGEFRSEALEALR
jgi:hypothetical protein